MYGRRSLSLPNGQLGRAERFADDVTGEEGEIYEPVTCRACTRAHLVSRSTGKVLSAGI